MQMFRTKFQISECLYYQKPPALHAETVRDSYSPWLNIQFVTQHTVRDSYTPDSTSYFQNHIYIYDTLLLRDSTYSSWLIYEVRDSYTKWLNIQFVTRILQNSMPYTSETPSTFTSVPIVRELIYSCDS